MNRKELERRLKDRVVHKGFAGIKAPKADMVREWWRKCVRVRVAEVARGVKARLHLLLGPSCNVSPTLLYCTANRVMHPRDKAVRGSMEGFQW